MAANAIRQQDLFSVFCDLYPLGRQAGKEETHVLHAVDRLPDVVHGYIVVRQMAVNAFFSSVSAGMRPCLKFRFHHVAAAAEDRRLGFCQQLWRTQQQEEKYSSSDGYKNNKILNNLTGFFSAHLHLLTEDSPGFMTFPWLILQSSYEWPDL